jgi:hypothetical protein
MKEKHLNIVQMVLDHQLLDSNYIECGKVDDLEIEGGEGELKITALLTGPGVATDRLPSFLRPLAKWLFGRRVSRIPWEEVLIISGQIKLRSRADALGLNRAEKKAASWLEKLPGAK